MARPEKDVASLVVLSSPRANLRITRRPEQKAVPRWVAYLLGIPIAIIAALLAILFFSAFLSLFTVVAIGVALRVWWLRRRLPQV